MNHTTIPTMKPRAVIDASACDGAPGCPAARTCPTGAIKLAEDGQWYVSSSACTGCGKCVVACPSNVVRML